MTICSWGDPSIDEPFNRKNAAPNHSLTRRGYPFLTFREKRSEHPQDLDCLAGQFDPLDSPPATTSPSHIADTSPRATRLRRALMSFEGSLSVLEAAHTKNVWESAFAEQFRRRATKFGVTQVREKSYPQPYPQKKKGLWQGGN